MSSALLLALVLAGDGQVAAPAAPYPGSALPKESPRSGGGKGA